jgi:hypothetical protein
MSFISDAGSDFDRFLPKQPNPLEDFFFEIFGVVGEVEWAVLVGATLSLVGFCGTSRVTETRSISCTNVVNN